MDLEEHLDDYHHAMKPGELLTPLAQHRVLAVEVEGHRSVLDKIVALLDGEEIHSRLDGRVMGRKNGLVEEIKMLREARMERPKLKLSWGWMTLMSAIVGLLTAIMYLLVAVLSAIE